MAVLPEHFLLITFAVLLVVALTAISWIDARRLIIPDTLNLLLAFGGVGYQWTFNAGQVWFQLLGAALVGTAIYGVREAFFRRTGLVGLGLGDVKFVTAAALWISPFSLPQFILIASASALCFVGLARVAHGTYDRRTRVAFAPFLCLALLIVWASEAFHPSGLWVQT